MFGRSLQALLGVAALLLQMVLPAVHPQHGAPAVAAEAHAADHHAGPSVAAHDAFDCPLCAAIAHGRAGAPAASPEALRVEASAVAVAEPPVRLLAAPALTSAAPRGPPALA
jgi:hypothetical protein